MQNHPEIHDYLFPFMMWVILNFERTRNLTEVVFGRSRCGTTFELAFERYLYGSHWRVSLGLIQVFGLVLIYLKVSTFCEGSLLSAFAQCCLSSGTSSPSGGILGGSGLICVNCNLLCAWLIWSACWAPYHGAQWYVSSSGFCGSDNCDSWHSPELGNSPELRSPESPLGPRPSLPTCH